MKSLPIPLFLLLLLANPIFLKADYIDPESTVRALVYAARSKNIERIANIVDEKKLRNHPRHAHTIKSLVELLSGVDPDEIAFAHRPTDRLFVRMVKPLSLDFELEQMKTDKKPSILYRIVAIHP